MERVKRMQIAVIGKEECTDEEYEAAETAGHLIAAQTTRSSAAAGREG